MKIGFAFLIAVTACHGPTSLEDGHPGGDSGGSSGNGGTAFTGRGGNASGDGAIAGATFDIEGDGNALGAYPFTTSPTSLGGTMTFTNIGAPGWWPRRIDKPAGDPACTYKDGTDTWGGRCCMTKETESGAALSPFDRELTLILKAIDVKQLAIYQPLDAAADTRWRRVTAWDARTRRADNLWFTQQGDGSPSFPGDLTKNDCVGYVMQAPRFECGDGSQYYCPQDPGVLHRGYEGSKLIVLLASVSFADADVKSCGGTGAGKPSPWVAIVASELVRDGGRKWNGLCNCYSKTGSVGDGCGEINVFEVVMDDNAYSNREFASTGVRSYQAGHLGGAVASATLDVGRFSADTEVVDVCSSQAYAKGPVLVAGGGTDGCPVWRRPTGDRYYFILLDAATRTIQIGILHPANVPPTLSGILPRLPASLGRRDIDAMLSLRLPS
jgi:hypothetical protein